MVPNPRNPRRSFAEADLADLTQSIREHGLVQPVVVRPTATGGRYEIIAGERRWRAAQRAGLKEVPVIVREVDDRVALELAIIENVQRADLNAVEEALGYQQLIDDHNYSQADLGQVIGKSRSHVANTLRLLKLPDAVRDMLVNGSLSAGHARTLVTAAAPVELAKRIVEEGLSVRQAEVLAQAPRAEEGRGQAPSRVEKDADTKALERLLCDVTGLKVAINHRDGGGEVKIAYRSLEQLDELCRRLKS
jgi:ParB family chromosome partitioning protein